MNGYQRILEMRRAREALPDVELTAEVRRHNIEAMKRPPAPPRVVGPWHSASVHKDDCCCERCARLGVNGCA